MTDETIGARIRLHRERAGLTQEELAGKAGLGVRTIRDLESGKVRRPRGPSLRDVDLGMTLSSLGEYAAAREHLGAAERTLGAVGDVRGRAQRAERAVDGPARGREPAAAVGSVRQALVLLEGIGDRRLVAVTRALVGWAELEAGDPGAALVTLRAALVEAEELHSPENEGISRCGLGEAHRRLGDRLQHGPSSTRPARLSGRPGWATGSAASSSGSAGWPPARVTGRSRGTTSSGRCSCWAPACPGPPSPGPSWPRSASRPRTWARRARRHRRGGRR